MTGMIATPSDVVRYGFRPAAGFFRIDRFIIADEAGCFRRLLQILASMSNDEPSIPIRPSRTDAISDSLSGGSSTGG